MHFREFCRLALLLVVAAFFCGCDRVASGPVNEEKDPHYLQGLNRMKSFDHKGAIESFERALETNPRSAAAHYRLGLLYEEKEADPAAAIYHYTRFLKLRPDSEEARNIEPRISGCKMDLAKSVSFAPQVNSMQRDIERLNAENMELKKKIEAMQAATAARPVEAATNRFSATVVTNALRSPDARSSVTVTNATREPPRPLRKYQVRERDTASSIARRYGVSLESLLRANPGLDPRRMRPGQTLNIPGS